MKLEHLFIGGLLITLMFALGFGFYAELLNNEGISLDNIQEFSDVNNNVSGNTQAIYTATQDIQNDITGAGVTDDAAENEMYAAAFEGVRNKPHTIATLSGNALQVFGTKTQIMPADVWKFISAVVIILAAAAVLYFIRGIPHQ